MTNPGQDDLFGPPHHLGIRRDRCLASEGIQRFHHRSQVAGLVVDDRDGSQQSLGAGQHLAQLLIPEQATRRARAKALNRASIL